METQQQLDEIEELRSDFIAIVTHELRTPLTSLLGFAELLERTGDRTLSSISHQQIVDGISNSVARLDRHITELEHLAQLEADSLEISIRSTRLQDLLERAVAGIETVRPVETEIERDLPDVLIDPERLIEALSELIDNAIKFSDEGSPILLQARMVEDQIEIAVIDRGTGISRPLAEKVLDRFAQAESPLARGAGGLGLGLPMARALIERMGGALHLIAGRGGGPRVLVPTDRGTRPGVASAMKNAVVTRRQRAAWDQRRELDSLKSLFIGLSAANLHEPLRGLAEIVVGLQSGEATTAPLLLGKSREFSLLVEEVLDLVTRETWTRVDPIGFDIVAELAALDRGEPGDPIHAFGDVQRFRKVATLLIESGTRPVVSVGSNEVRINLPSRRFDAEIVAALARLAGGSSSAPDLLAFQSSGRSG